MWKGYPGGWEEWKGYHGNCRRGSMVDMEGVPWVVSRCGTGRLKGYLGWLQVWKGYYGRENIGGWRGLKE